MADAELDEEVMGTEDDGEGDPELEEMKRRVQEMEDEAAAAAGEKPLDDCSIHVSQVDYDATPEELQAHFASCGTINRVTIICDKFTGRSKGFAYVEFDEKESVITAQLLDNSIFKGRQLKVTIKRVNVPGKGKGRGKGAKGGRGGGRKGAYAKGGYAKGSYAKGGYAKGGYRPY